MSERVDQFLCLSVDVQAYGRTNHIRQTQIQRDLVDLLDTAADAAGLDRGQWLRQAKGDEELCLIPASQPPHIVVGEFLTELDATLRRRNGTSPSTERLRVRVGIDHGPAQLGANGFVGDAVVRVSRLVNSAALRQALHLADTANLAAVIADVVYRDWIASGLSTTEPDRFRQVHLTEKELSTKAWLWVPGANVHELTLSEPTGQDAPVISPPTSGQHVTNTFGAPVNISGGAIFGINNA